MVTTITAELHKHLIDAKPINGTLPMVDDRSPEEINGGMMSALIAEPKPVMPPYEQVEIPLAVNEKLIDTKDGIIPDDATREDTGGVSFNGYDTVEIREGTEGDDVGEDKESGDTGQDEESVDGGQDEESGVESDT